ncbi:hypothetical protein F4814DRAFT_453062 [Daldinia grandis]|nr:hypothetical protein F4814DRAFT_453062 [Daldinia grandis]
MQVSDTADEEDDLNMQEPMIPKKKSPFIAKKHLPVPGQRFYKDNDNIVVLDRPSSHHVPSFASGIYNNPTSVTTPPPPSIDLEKGLTDSKRILAAAESAATTEA